MAATILVREVLHRVSAQLLDISPQFIRWTERELVQWLNDAQRAVAKYLPPAFSRMDAVRLQAGTRQSIETIPQANIIPGNGDAASPQRGRALLDVHRNMGADGQTPGTSIRLVAREHLDLNNNTWHSASPGVPALYVFDPRTPKYFHTFPPVPGTPTWVEISYLADPKDVPLPGAGQTLYAWGGASSTLIAVDDMYVDDIVNYILARAHAKESESAGNAQLSALYTKYFVESINAQATALTGVNPNLQFLPLSPNAPAAAR